MSAAADLTGPLPAAADLAETESLFQQPWWLEATAPGRWQELRVEQNGQLQARWPFTLKRRFGLTVLSQPPLTQTLGPWIREQPGKPPRRLSNEMNLLEELIAKLPEYDYFAQNFPPGLGNWLPFYWKGFNQSILCTYVFDELEDLDLVWKNFEDSVRNQVRKAQKALVVREDADLDVVLDAHDLSFLRQGRPVPFGRDLVRRIDAAAAARDCRLKLTAEDAQGRTHASLYVVWDARCCHALFTGGDPALRSSGAGSLLLWEALRRVSPHTKRFNYGGSMIEPVETYIRNFGARQVRYYRLTHMSRRMRLFQAGYDLLNAVKGKE